MEGRLLLHVPSKTVTFECDVSDSIKDYVATYGINPKAILVRVDSELPAGETYQDIPVIRQSIVSPNNFLLLWSTKEIKKEAIWIKK
jgi:sulfur carrier protein ThiS